MLYEQRRIRARNGGNDDAGRQEIELQVHGGPGVVAWCLAFAEGLGCRRIDWAEWWSEPLWKLLPLATTNKIDKGELIRMAARKVRAGA